MDAVYRFALSPDGHRVAFQSGSQVYTMNLDGSNLVALAKDGAPKVYRSFMSWSPDGSRIAFTFRNNLDNNRAIQIYVANADGSDLVNLGQNLVPGSAIAWSPDGSKIAFAASVESGLEELHTINADGTNAAIIAFLGSSATFAWSPGGSQFLFQYCKYGECYPFVFLIAADGHEQSPRKLPQQPLKGNLSSPTWSPDGSKIAFALSSRDNTKPEIAMLNIDGENISPLTQNSKWDNLYDIIWSPGGSKIAFKASQGGNEYIYRINADGSNLTQLTKRPGVVYSQIAWVPVSPAAFAPEATAVAAPTIPALTVLMAYPGQESCTIQVNTQAWKIGDYWKKNILGQKDNTSSQVVLVSNNFLIYLLEHQTYPGCQVAWAPAVGFEGMTSKESFETINAKKWKIWNVENNAIRVYFLTELDIRFMQTAPNDDTQRQGCTEDVYQILESVSCGQSIPTSTPTPHTSGSSLGKIAFISEREMYYTPISIINADGSNLVRSSNTLVQVEDLRWSPKGNKIAFVAKLGDAKSFLRGEIYLINTDGSLQINLTNNNAEDKAPAWSPDGSRIVFMSNRDGNNEIYTITTKGTNLTNLTQNSAEDSFPAWSPDGSQIAFSSNRNGKNEIYVMDTNGSNPTRLADAWDILGPLTWSPDGNKLAFVASVGEAIIPHLFVINSDGSNQVAITPKGFDGSSFSWSPDGSRIVFASIDGEIYVINADGSNPVNLTQDPAHDISPAWSPDGSQIVFQSDRDGNPEIYVMNADGSHPIRLTNNSTWDVSPVWAP